jgi:hypothetical protein
MIARVRTLRLAVLLACLGCDGNAAPADSGSAKATTPSEPTLTPADVCKAWASVEVPPHVVVIAASATQGAIAKASDGDGMTGQVVELRAESGAIENGQKRIDGIGLTRKFTLKHDGTAWTIAEQKVVARDEIFYLRKAPDQDPRKLFGTQVIERYGPKGGTPCEVPGAQAVAQTGTPPVSPPAPR